MATTDAYATPAEYRKSAVHISDDDTDVLTRDLLAISRLIDRRLDRLSGFAKDASATTRVYHVRSARPTRPDWAESENPWLYGGATRILDVEDIGGAVTSIKWDSQRTGTYDVTLTTDDYELLPSNASVHGEPYRQISLTPWGDYSSFPSGSRVQVIAIHGWPSVPAGIKVACIELTAMLRGESEYSTNRIQELDSIEVVAPQARKVINDLMTTYHGGLYF